ncbi:MAG: hypothetical protein HFP81_01155 [Methylococcales symbiont of Hymedesmia sp. n. MRB-2018]|nr:MAG: hypothetical protein HFP78_02415 [Methylococcales symbiont of Hymedesmia sp. n. MRB-2018]KAF3984654.1 MAG: hypothetical protein HFP81_01155 [Methylococcales symbiont of Hymedesmia sp. n. MRB-2018]
MPADIILTVIATTVIQSVFGVGVLLFGTPILLLLGYDFFNVLSILLPISIAINSLQILKHYQFIDTTFYKNVLIYTIPFVVLFLFFVSMAKLNIDILIGVFLILVALKSYFPVLEQSLQKMLKHERSYLVTIGVVHGLTNLGGSLLTAIVHGKNHQKDTTRVTVAICYATFAFFQLITLFLLGSQFGLLFAGYMSFVQLGVIVFLLTEEIVYRSIDNQKYSQFFAAFLLLSGVLLIIK